MKNELTRNWEELIKDETGEIVTCCLEGESQLLVKCSELGQFFVNGLFSVYGKKAEFVSGGLVIELE